MNNSVLIVLLVVAAVAIIALLSRRRGSERIVVKERVVVEERIVYRDPEPLPKKQGPALWELNADFTEFVSALAGRVDALIGEHDRDRIASYAGISRGTLDNLIKGSNPQLQTLWKVCNARRTALSQLFAEAEAGLQDARAQRAGRAARSPAATEKKTE